MLFPNGLKCFHVLHCPPRGLGKDGFQEIVFGNIVLWAGGNDPLTDVSDLPDIAGPAVRVQKIDGLLLKSIGKAVRVQIFQETLG